MEQGLHRVGQAAVLQAPLVVAGIAVEGIDHGGPQGAGEAHGQTDPLRGALGGGLAVRRLGVEAAMADQGRRVLLPGDVEVAGADLHDGPVFPLALHQVDAAADDQVGPGPSRRGQLAGQGRTLDQGPGVVGAAHGQGDQVVDAPVRVDQVGIEGGEDGGDREAVVAHEGELAQLSVGAPAALPLRDGGDADGVDGDLAFVAAEQQIPILERPPGQLGVMGDHVAEVAAEPSVVLDGQLVQGVARVPGEPDPPGVDPGPVLVEVIVDRLGEEVGQGAPEALGVGRGSRPGAGQGRLQGQEDVEQLGPGRHLPQAVTAAGPVALDHGLGEASEVPHVLVAAGDPPPVLRVDLGAEEQLRQVVVEALGLVGVVLVVLLAHEGREGGAGVGDESAEGRVGDRPAAVAQRLQSRGPRLGEGGRPSVDGLGAAMPLVEGPGAKDAGPQLAAGLESGGGLVLGRLV